MSSPNIQLFLTPRMGFKSTFAKKELFLKQPEKFTFFTQNDKMNKSMWSHFNWRPYINNIRTATKQNLICTKTENIICDDYENIKKDFREELFWRKNDFKNIYLFASVKDSQNYVFPIDEKNFGHVVDRLRSYKLDPNKEPHIYSEYEHSFYEEEVLMLPSTKIYNLETLEDVTYKELLILQRFTKK